MAASPHLAELRMLCLILNGMSPDGVAALVGGGLPSLEVLSVWANPLGDVGAKAIAAGCRLAGLRVLKLSRCGIGDAGAVALAESPALAGLIGLDDPEADIGMPIQELLKERFGTRVRLEKWNAPKGQQGP